MVVKTRPHYFRGENETIKKWYLFPDLGVVCTTSARRTALKKDTFTVSFFIGFWD
jgi:hypothetical protein